MFHVCILSVSNSIEAIKIFFCCFQRKCFNHTKWKKSTNTQLSTFNNCRYFKYIAVAWPGGPINGCIAFFRLLPCFERVSAKCRGKKKVFTASKIKTPSCDGDLLPIVCHATGSSLLFSSVLLCWPNWIELHRNVQAIEKMFEGNGAVAQPIASNCEICIFEAVAYNTCTHSQRSPSRSIKHFVRPTKE